MESLDLKRCVGTPNVPLVKVEEVMCTSMVVMEEEQKEEVLCPYPCLSSVLAPGGRALRRVLLEKQAFLCDEVCLLASVGVVSPRYSQ